MTESPWQTLETSSRRIEKAIEAGSLDARLERHVSWAQRPLDQRGWRAIVAGVEGLRQRAEAERLAAARRLERSGDKPIPATMILAVFESPWTEGEAVPALDDDRWEVAAEPRPDGDAGLTLAAKVEALVTPARMDVITRATRGPLTPAEFAREHPGVSVEEAAHHFEALRRYGWLQQIEERGAASRPVRWQRLYRVDRAPLLDNEVWAALPPSVRAVFTSKALEAGLGKVREALETGTFDAREDRHYSCAALPLDLEGWKRAVALTDTLFEFLVAEQIRARRRLVESGETPFLATCLLTTFESPGGPRRQPPRQLGHLQSQTPDYMPATRWPTLRELK